MKKSFVWIVIAAVAGYLVFFGLPEFSQQQLDPRSAERLSKIAAELNRSVPVMIDKETELTVVEGHEAMLIYKYRLVPYSVRQLNHERFAAGARDRVVQGACSRPETSEDFLKKGVTLRYSYFDKDKQHIATIDVTPKDCGF